MTSSKLKYLVENSGNEPYFFTKDTMKFFGDTMKNYGVKDAGNCWELYRKHPVEHGRQHSDYFDKITFQRVFK